MVDVFVGFVFDEDKEKELLHFSKRGVQVAANQYQNGFLSGLQEQVQIVSCLSTGTFPEGNKKLFFKRELKMLSTGQITYLPFLNFYVIRDMMFRTGLYWQLRRIIKTQEHTTVYVYSLYMPSLKSMVKLKK